MLSGDIAKYQIQDRVRAAEALGLDLWWDLPDAFRAFYWSELHGKDVSIAIYSQEPYIPWELIRPQRERAGEEADFLGVIDLVRMRALTWRGETKKGEDQTVEEIPETHREAAQQWHDRLIETVAEAERALETVRERNQRWDEEDARWYGEAD